MEVPEKIEMRKIIPVVARISAGKSKLLNILYNINFLECKAGIATKFINLLRYNPNINEPRFFHLNIKKEGEKYNFYRDTDYNIIIGKENIIKENKILNKKYSFQNFKYEDIFYMTEINNSPFIKDEKYLLTHDLCDVPGLSEAQNEIKEKNDTKFEEDLINEKIKQNNEISKIEDEIFYHIKEERNTYLSEVFNIMKNYIDGGIIILSIENYYFPDNYELITKFHKVINKTISNFLIILNKIDLCLDESKEYIEKCKGLIFKYFPDCKTFNLNANTFIPLSTFRLKDELLLKDNFNYLMKYHTSNYISRIKALKKDNDNSIYISFIDYLKEIIKLEERLEKINKNNNLIDLNDVDKKTIYCAIEEIKDEYKHENIILGINYGIKNNIDNSPLNDDDVINYLFICHRNNKLIPLPSEETFNLLNYFRTDKLSLQNENKFIDNDNNFDEGINMKKKNMIKNIYDIISQLKEYRLLKDEAFNQINEDYYKLKELETENNIFIPFLGPKNSGIPMILNAIIGEDIFPTDMTSQKIFIINDNDKNDNIYIKKVKLIKKQKSNNDIYYYFDLNDDYIIAKGINNVKETIKGLNYEFTDKFNDKYLNNPENYFYLIKTKIKLFDNLIGINKDIKKKIYLFDFSCLDNNTNELRDFIFSNILKKINSFIFILSESLINDQNSRFVLWNLFEQTMEKKCKIHKGFIKYCLFILNMDINEKKLVNDASINSYKNEVKSIIKLPKDSKIDINFFLFKTKSFFSDIKNYNYFFNIKDTINSIFKEYYKIKSLIFKYPESFNRLDIKGKNEYSKKYISFQKYLTIQVHKVYNELKNSLEKKDSPKKEQIIDEKIIESINESIKDLEIPYYKIKFEFSEENKKKLYKYFSAAQNKLNYSSIFENHKFNILGNIIVNLVNISIEEKDLIFKERKETINKKLNILFNRDLSKEREDDYKEFKIKINELINKINTYLKNQINQIVQIKKESLSKINVILDSKKQAIINETLKEKSKSVKNSILEEIKKELKELNNHINNLFNNINGTGNSYFLEIKKELYKFLNSEVEKDIEDIRDFKRFFLTVILNRNDNDIDENIIENSTNEIQIYFDHSISRIFDEKGFLESFKSYFSRISFFRNFIEMISKYISDRIEYILGLLSDNLSNYVKDKIDLIKFRIDLYALNYTHIDINKIKEEWYKIINVE